MEEQVRAQAGRLIQFPTRLSRRPFAASCSMSASKLCNSNSKPASRASGGCKSSATLEILWPAIPGLCGSCTLRAAEAAKRETCSVLVRKKTRTSDAWCLAVAYIAYTL